MSHAADKGVASRQQESSPGELVKQLMEQVSLLVRDELKLAQLELTRKGKQAKGGATLLGASGLVAFFGAACLIACAAIALSLVVTTWAAVLIVGAILLAIAAALAAAGRSRLSAATPPMPAEAAESVRADLEVIRERARR